MKGCLKLPSRASSPTPHHCHQCPKHVVFDADGSEQIFFADEWDRTPAEPARNLSYSDIMELKQIQRSLPRAIQPADVKGSHFLSTVPIGLLPLLPESDTASPLASTAPSTASFPLNSWRTVHTPTPAAPRAQIPPHPSHLSHLPPARPPVNREKSRFAFLPLLGTDSPRAPSPPSSPPPSERSSSPDYLLSDTASDVSHDPPTPALTNASLNSSPLSRPSSCSPEPPAFHLPLSKNRGHHWRDSIPSDVYLPSSRLSSAHSSSESLVHDPYDYRRPGYGASTKVQPIPIPTPKPPSTPKKPKKEKNVIVINGIEIELDDDKPDGNASDSDSEEEGSTPPARPGVSIPQRDQIPSPTPTRAYTFSSPPSSPPMSLHTPMHFKRTSTASASALSSASASSVSSSPPVAKQACSPPRTAGTTRSSPLMVPSA